ncbi:pre-mRNA-processing factor 19 [Anaeramoeba flamelloides]|uniref:Pre-mRNA-processing factor 19 n=1 Tax=Anaeramoeba flamelloides TaxID=1746091 RepID=A0ABQ8Z9E3_9EUKA|nr:pre-mRNA-processing factor 19 [Anaeramoeba flamelloides]
MFCSFSGQPAEDPVVTTSGYLFERRLIEKYLQTEGTCPITKKVLTEKDLIPVKLPSVSKQIKQTVSSIPKLIEVLQTEWDSIILESFALKKELHNTREELARTLYEYDAACRVIARLITERDEARAALAKSPKTDKNEGKKIQKKQKANQKDDDQKKTNKNTEKEMKIENESQQLISQEKVQEFVHLSEKLGKKRKIMRSKLRKHKIKLPKIEKYQTISTSNNIFEKETDPIIALEPVEHSPNLVIALNDNNSLCIYDYEKSNIISKLKFKDNHKKMAANQKMESFVVGSTKGDITLWDYNLKNQENEKLINCNQKFTINICDDDNNDKAQSNSQIIDVNIHPDNKTLVTCLDDLRWILIDLETQKKFRTFNYQSNQNINLKYSSNCIHPDGTLVLCGLTNNNIQVWDIRSEQIAATLQADQNCTVDQVLCSNYGVHVASVTSDSIVRLWDLRDQVIIETLDGFDLKKNTCVAFDQTGSHLSIGNSNKISNFGSKKWKLLKEFNISNQNSCIEKIVWSKNNSLIIGDSFGVIENFNLK